jgi:hypothetical protein
MTSEVCSPTCLEETLITGKKSEKPCLKMCSSKNSSNPDHYEQKIAKTRLYIESLIVSDKITGSSKKFKRHMRQLKKERRNLAILRQTVLLDQQKRLLKTKNDIKKRQNI